MPPHQTHPSQLSHFSPYPPTPTHQYQWIWNHNQHIDPQLFAFVPGALGHAKVHLQEYINGSHIIMELEAPAEVPGPDQPLPEGRTYLHGMAISGTKPVASHCLFHVLSRLVDKIP